VTYFIQVLIFAEKKQDVDAIHEYLLLKGVEAVSIHGGKGKAVNYAAHCVCHPAACRQLNNNCTNATCKFLL
jgi:hypothetical protein